MPRPTRFRLIAGALALTVLIVNPLTVHGRAPVTDSPNGRAVTLIDPAAEPGGTIRFTGTGYVNANGTGQTVTVKLNDVDILGTFEASADGAISGSVPIPASLSPGSAYWLRFLAGAGKPDDMPATSLHVDISVTAAAAATTLAPGGTQAVPAGQAQPSGTSEQSGDLVSSGDEMTRNLVVAAALAAVGLAGLAVDRLLRRHGRTTDHTTLSRP